MTPDADRAERIAIAARDTCRALIVLATLADGPATNDALRKATGHPGDSFRSLLRRMARAGLIEALPGERVRWALADRHRCIPHHSDRRAYRGIALPPRI